MEEYINDLSYSNLASIIRGVDSRGADCLDSIAHEMEEANSVIEKVESELSRIKARRNALIEGSKRILGHLKRETPLAVQREGYIIVVTDENISIERNVL